MSVSSRQRRRLAQESARIIIESGLMDFLAAKQKAARNLGVEGNAIYPSNEEIEAALAEYHRIFRPATQDAHIARLRHIALKTMTFMEDFSPRLVGGVLDGTAGEFAPITLHLFAETAEEIVIKLLNSRTPFTQGTHEVWTAKKEKLDFPAFHLVVDGANLELKFFPARYLRQLRKAKGGRPKAASLSRLRKLMQEGNDCGLADGLPHTATRDLAGEGAL